MIYFQWQLSLATNIWICVDVISYPGTKFAAD